MDSIDELSTYDNSDDGYISTNSLEDTWDGSQINPELNARDAIINICDHIKQTKNEWKVAELSENRMGKGLHKFFKAVVNELKNVLPTLGESGSEVSHFIPEPRNFQKSPDYHKMSKRLDWMHIWKR